MVAAQWGTLIGGAALAAIGGSLTLWDLLADDPPVGNQTAAAPNAGTLGTLGVGFGPSGPILSFSAGF